jgi:hypothetical protein
MSNKTHQECRWKNGYTIKAITSELERAKEVTPEGKAQFKGWHVRTLQAVLTSAFEWHPEVPDGDKSGIMWQSITEVATEGVITPNSLQQCIYSKQNSYLSQSRQRYVLITSISIDRRLVLPRTIMAGSTIIFETRSPQRFQKALAEMNHETEIRGFHQVPEEYQRVRVHVSARSISDAISCALGNIDLLRGIWNLGLNIAKGGRWSSGPKRQPVNQIILGPLHTLHLPSGKAATELWWYEPHYEALRQLYDPTEHIERMRRFSIWGRQCLKRLSYRAQVTKAITDYSRALDHRDWNTAFLQLWGVLEDITFTGMEKYEITIKRASFIWEESRYRKQVLLHLRDLRNSFVHDNAASDEIEAHMYDLKRYVEQLIVFHLRNGHRFANVGEVKQFLDLPQDRADMQRNIELYAKAKRFRERKKF